MPDIPLVISIAPLGAIAVVWFLDIWGVLHNGFKPYASAVEACMTFRKAGGHVVLVSNSPRPRAGVIRQLDDIGVDRQAFDDLITSGDVSRALIAELAPGPVFHIGPGRDLPLFDGLGIGLTGEGMGIAAVCTGLYDDESETPNDYASTLQALRVNETPMICANPDITAERGGKIIYCAGAIAQAYEALGGRVRYAGKPYAPIYEAALQIASRLCGASVTKDRVLAIGDGVETDIRGASASGIRSVYIASGVHVARGVPQLEAVRTLFATEPLPPIAAMTALAW